MKRIIWIISILCMVMFAAPVSGLPEALELPGESTVSVETAVPAEPALLENVPAQVAQAQPAITITPFGAVQMTYGERLVIEAAVTAGEPESITFYVNDTVEYISYEAPAILEFEKPAGTHTVYARLKDKNGAEADSERLTVTVAQNDLPVVSFDGWEGSVSISAEQAKRVKILAEDSNGIQRVEVTVGGTAYHTLAEAPYIIDLSGLGSGSFSVTATAYDSFGLSSSHTVLFQIYGVFRASVYEKSDFAYSMSGTRMVFDSSFYAYPRIGYIKNEAVDAEHGNSLVIGSPTEQPAGTGSPYTVLTVNNSSNLTMEFETYFSSGYSSNAVFYYRIMGSGVEFTVFRWEKGQIIAGSRQVACESGVWHRMTASYDVGRKSYSLWMDGVALVEDEAYAAGIGSLETIRFYGSSTGTVVGSMAIDNMNISTLREMPYITEVGYDGQKTEEKIPYQAKSIEVYLSNPIYRVEKDQISLRDGEREIPIEKAAYDAAKGAIVFYPAQSLTAARVYHVRLDQSLLVYADTPIGVDMTVTFETAARELEIEHVSFAKSGQGIVISAEATNHSDGEREGLLVASIWEGDTIVRSFAVPFQIAADTAQALNMTLPSVLTSQRIEFCVWNGMEGAEVLSPERYSYQK